MIRITQLKLPITHTEEQLHRKIAKMLRLGNQPLTYEIRKQSLDARHKEDKKFVYTVDIKLDNESRVLKKVHDKNIMLTSEKKYHFPSSGSETLSHRPIVIGSGPAGLFCAWYLAKAGYCPLVLERGEEADKRQETVENFWKNGILDPDSNVQFGEGGAGTFSDGKLNTLVKDTFGRGKEVLSRFVEAGAPSEILYQQKPHLGTDQLVGIVQFMRHQIEEMGGEFRFRSTVTDLMIRDRKLNAVIVNAKEEIPAEICILAPGHSARDTFAMLEKHNIKATFFMVGDNIKKHPDEYRMVVEHGHRIGNHTFNHIRGFEYSNPDYLANAQKVDEIIHSDLFRPPHGHMGFRQYYTLRYHYRIIMWDLVTRDYSKRMRPEQVLNNVKRYARNGSIITFHDSLKSWNNGNLQYALPRSIEFLKAEGYEFKVL